MHQETCTSAHTGAQTWSSEAPKLLVKKHRWLADWLRRLDLGFFFLPAIFLMGAFQPCSLKGKCKLWDKLPCVMMRHESKGRTSGTDYISASCAKDIYCFALNSVHTVMASIFGCHGSHEVAWWLSELPQFLSKLSSFASSLATWTVCLLKHMFRLSSPCGPGSMSATKCVRALSWN